MDEGAGGEGCPSGESIHPQEKLPQTGVDPGPEVDRTGPRDWEDLILHTGEARGAADTAYHSLEPDAPTLGAALRGHETEEEGLQSAGMPTSNRGPD